MDACVAGGKLHLIIHDRFIPHLDVVLHGVVEQSDLLVYHSQGTFEHRTRNLINCLAIEQDLSAPGFHEACDHLRDGRFSGTRSSHQRHPLSGCQAQAEILNQGIIIPGITKRDMVQFHLAGQFLNRFIINPLVVILKTDLLRIIHHIVYALQGRSHCLQALSRLQKIIDR